MTDLPSLPAWAKTLRKPALLGGRYHLLRPLSSTYGKTVAPYRTQKIGVTLSL